MLQSDDFRWFPMRVTYNRELIIKELLDNKTIQNYVPMRYDWVDKKKVLVPAIHNLIFVHTTQETLTHLKMTKKEFEPLRYIMKYVGDGNTEILTVPDKQMTDFMKVASDQESAMFLDYNDFISKAGKKVRITGGYLKDVEGVFKRIKKNKYIVVQIDGVAAVATTYVPACFISFI